MSGVKRYTLDIDCIYPCEDGEYVLASDYDRLELECARLRSVYEEDTRRIKGINALADNLKTERDELRAQKEVMRAALAEAKYRIEQGRVWAGTKWKSTGLHPLGQQKALDVIDAALQVTP